MSCDCPSLNEQNLEQALTALNQENEVVLAQTRNRIERYKLRHYELSEQWDLDTPKGLERYRALAPKAKTATLRTHSHGIGIGE